MVLNIQCIYSDSRTLLCQCIILPLHVAVLLTNNVWKHVSLIIDYQTINDPFQIIIDGDGVCKNYFRLHTVIKDSHTNYSKGIIKSFMNQL